MFAAVDRTVDGMRGEEVARTLWSLGNAHVALPRRRFAVRVGAAVARTAAEMGPQAATHALTGVARMPLPLPHRALAPLLAAVARTAPAAVGEDVVDVLWAHSVLTRTLEAPQRTPLLDRLVAAAPELEPRVVMNAFKLLAELEEDLRHPGLRAALHAAAERVAPEATAWHLGRIAAALVAMDEAALVPPPLRAALRAGAVRALPEARDVAVVALLLDALRGLLPAEGLRRDGELRGAAFAGLAEAAPAAEKAELLGARRAFADCGWEVPGGFAALFELSSSDSDDA